MSRDDQYINIIKGFTSKHILVIGDLLLDVYLKGKSTRLCPEAPVPVVDVEERTVALGGAANVVCNLKSLGAVVTFCTVIGNDTDGEEALHLLHSIGVERSCVIQSPDRKSITKVRVVSGTQVITRFDQGSEGSIDDRLSRKLAGFIRNAYKDCDAVIISDYDKGVVTKALVETIADLRRTKDKMIVVDSKRLPFFSPLKPSCVKPNYDEILKLAGDRATPDRLGQIHTHAKTLCDKTKARLVIATLDEDGSLLIERGKVIHHIPSRRTTKPYVSGAGDTYISAFVLSSLESSDAHISAEIATAAASIAIEKDSTATCSQTELRTFFNIHAKFISNIKDLEEICNRYHATGKRIVFTNGCFDILHSGHVTYLHKAKQLGDVLVVGLNTDESIRRIKGNDRPINGLADRLQVLAGLSSVDHIIPFGNSDDDTPIPLIRVVKPDIFVKGGDYTKEKLPEAKTVEASGGKIVFVDHVPDHSTTRIIRRITSQGQATGLVF